MSVVEAPAEGETQAAHVARHGDAGYVGTEDYDALLFGAPLTLRKLTSRDSPELLDLEATLERHGVTREQLVDVAVLCGTDYNDGVHGYGPVTALDAVREHGDLWGVVEAAGLDADGSIDVEDAETVRALFLDPEVTDDYAVDRTVAPDLARVREYVVGEWGIPEEAVATAFERLEACTPLSV